MPLVTVNSVTLERTVQSALAPRIVLVKESVLIGLVSVIVDSWESTAL